MKFNQVQSSHCRHWIQTSPLSSALNYSIVGTLLYLFDVLHTIQELTGDGVQLQQVHTIEGTLQQLKDGGQLKMIKRTPSEEREPNQNMPRVKKEKYLSPVHSNSESLVIDKTWALSFFDFDQMWYPCL